MCADWLFFYGAFNYVDIIYNATGVAVRAVCIVWAQPRPTHAPFGVRIAHLNGLYDVTLTLTISARGKSLCCFSCLRILFT